MPPDFMIRAAIAGFGVAVATGLLGCFVVWRRMAYFGDATSHAAILGVALALIFSLPVLSGVVLVSLIVGLLVTYLASKGQTADTSLGVVSHAALAMGLVALALVPGPKPDIEAFLFGDILAISWGDVALVWLGTLLVCAVLLHKWNALLTATLSEELAWAEALHPRHAQLVLTLVMALVVALALKIVGALLITAMLIIPAAAAKGLSRTPEAMAMVSVAIGVFSVSAGLTGAWFADLPAGPAIVCASVFCFALGLLLERR